MLNGDVSHDHITRFLSQRTFTSKDLWLQVKPTVRDIEHDDGVLIFDDTVQEKAFTDENDIMCWHYDPSAGRHVRKLNILNALYHCQNVSIPVAFEIIRGVAIFAKACFEHPSPRQLLLRCPTSCIPTVEASGKN